MTVILPKPLISKRYPRTNARFIVSKMVETAASAGCSYSALLRKRKALPMTDAELKLMANAAIMGDSSQPVNG
jgi:hypothetical protein